MIQSVPEPPSPSPVTRTRTIRRLLSLAIGASLALSAVSPTWAADITARIRGTVTDPKGAVIPNVDVTATNSATGVTFRSKSSANGSYEFLQLPVGTYNISAQAPGFETFNATGIILTINQEYVEPVALAVGSETQTVSVQASAVQVDTSNMQLNNIVGSQQIVDLPLIGRDFTQLEQTLPGVQASSDRFGSFSANGAQSQQSAYLINGTDSNDLPLNGITFTPSVDAISQFNLITSSLNPEYSRNSGAIVSATIKNGTNQFHGNAFEFYRDTFLNNKNFFQPAAPKYHQNLFGGTIGGPIWKDKLFFFGSYQGTRAVRPDTGVSGTNVVYSAAQRSGNWMGTTFSDNPIPGTIQIPGCASGETYNSCFTRLNGQIPTSAFNPISTALVNKYVPLPNSSGNRYLLNPTTTVVQDQEIGRVDFNPNSKDQIWGLLIFQRYPTTDLLPFTGGTLPGFGDVNTSNIHQFAASWSHIFSSTTLNEIQAHYNRFNYQAVSPQNVVQPSSLGFAITSQNPSVASVPKINIPGYFALGFSNNGPQPRVDQTYQINDNFSKVVGRHSLKFGYDGRRFNVDNPFYSSNNGSFGFSSTNTLGSGNAALDFLLGVPTSYSQSAGGRIDAYAFENYFYGQDSWRVTDAFTVTYGLGYQIDTALHNRQYGGEGVTCFLPGQQSKVFPTAPVGLNYPSDRGCNDASGAVTAWKDVGPRIGFAWSPDLGALSGGNSHKLSIRGGFGIYFNRSEEETSLNNLGDPPFGLSSSGAVDYNAVKPGFQNPYQDINTGAVYPNKFPGTFAKPGQPVDFTPYEPFLLSQYAPGFRVPYSENFQLTIERELPSNIVARISYVGALGRHEQITGEGNPITPAGHAACLADPACANDNRDVQPLQYPDHTLYGNGDVFTSIGLVRTEGSSNYNALELSATKGFSHGLLFQASYTLAHSLDDSSNYEDAGYGGSVRGYNQFQPSLNYGNSSFDARHRFVFSPIYMVPNFGPHALAPLTKGWQVSGIVTLATGFPYDISYGGFYASNSLWCADSATFYACPDVPVQVAPLKRTNPRAGGNGLWFDPTASFVDEPIGSFGNISRYKFHGPGINNTNAIIAKNIYLGHNESRFVQLRLESYNIFNHTQFGTPSTNVDGNFADGPFPSGTFGALTTAAPGRQTQLAAKFYF